ncbi:hypothetical protein [Nocardia carnea]|uniref:hypothetical protein n=1 Tax=Nocardia carnea TaxID=37328 RepID=UPI002454D0C3|nr:hypothetical protein [Nocardia carnea]
MGVDVTTVDVSASAELIEILRRDDVAAFLLVQGEDTEPTKWMDALDTQVVHRLDFTSVEEAARFGDSVQVGIRTTENGAVHRLSRASFFDVYSQLDANAAARILDRPAIPLEERYRAAAFACAASDLGVDVIVTGAAVASRADVADNDLVISVCPEDLLPIFGHYLRRNGNHKFRITTGRIANGGSWENTASAGSIKELYAWAIDSGMVHFQCLYLMADMTPLRDPRVAEALLSIRTRLGRAARALDELLGALSNTAGKGTAASDITEAAAEAFDREMLYLCAAFDGYGRLYATLIDTTVDPRKARDSLFSRTFLDKTLARYSADTSAIDAGQKFAFICSQLRHSIHASVLPAGQYLSRVYGSAETVALDLSDLDYFDPATTSLGQDQLDRLGVWLAEPDDVFGSRTYVADLATVATTLMITALEYIDAFSGLILCHLPSNAPNAHSLLGSAPDTGGPRPSPSKDELYQRKLFGWFINDYGNRG